MRRNLTAKLLIALAWGLALGGAERAAAGPKDVAFLLKGVRRIAAPGVPGPLCVFGPGAFVVVAADRGGGVRDPVVAVATMGKGRVVAFGHTDYLRGGALAVGETQQMVLGAVRWAAGRTGAKDAAPRAVVRRLGQLAGFLEKHGIRASELGDRSWREQLGRFDVLCLDATALRTDAELAAVRTFVEDGGGLAMVSLGWGWRQLNRGKSLLRDHPGNRLLAPAGIVWADGYLKAPGSAGYPVSAPPELAHAGRALDALVAHQAGKRRLTPAERTQAGAVLSSAARAVPPGDRLLLPRLRGLADKTAAVATPSPRKPLRQEQALARVLLAWQLHETMHAPAERVRAHPGAAAFPGAVPAEAKRVTRTTEVDTAVPNWHSTGLYAPPGGLITVRLPKSAAGGKLKLRIGAHKSALYGKDTWRRCPEILRVFALDAPEVKAANAFGGLIYVDVPDRCRLGRVRVTIRGAVEAPYYVAGRTDEAAWRKQIRRRPAPWAELATSKVILTVPSEAVRNLDDPADLMRFWDKVLDSCAELAARPTDRRRPERYVTDAQIAAGYMHAGYPIMTHLDVAPVIVSKAKLTSNAHGGVWGLFHELGHNHQSRDWTFRGTVEVTVNLFTLYVYEKVCGMYETSRPGLFGARRARRIKAHLDAGADFGKWQRDPFLALLMYMQLKEAFGWEAYQKVFAEYRALPARERPRSEAQKRDQWLVRFSRAVGRNLGPFFQAWGVPTGEKARAAIAKLPKWMPPGFPPK